MATPRENQSYMVGTGRVGKFLMNAMLASGGYPCTVIPVEERDHYMAALEATNVDQYIKPCGVCWMVEEGIKGALVAKISNYIINKNA